MVASQMVRYSGLRVSNRPVTTVKVQRTYPVRSRRSVTPTAGYIGSETNLIMCASTALCLIAGRFGLAPSANKRASAGLTLVDNASGFKSGDPSGFSAVDVLALGSFGHIIGAGIILGLRSIGQL